MKRTKDAHSKKVTSPTSARPYKGDMQSAEKVPLPGSHREMLPGAKLIGPVDREQTIEISLRLRCRSNLDQKVNLDQMGLLFPRDRRYVARERFASEFGANPDDIKEVEEFARTHNFKIVPDANAAARRLMRIKGKIKAIEAAFAVKLDEYDSPQGRFRGRTGSVHVPSSLAKILEGVFGLDNRCQARAHIILPDEEEFAFRAVAPRISFPPNRIGQFYNFPRGLDGEGQCIGILEFGGGFDPADMEIYFKQLGLSVPDVTAVSVGAENQPRVDPDADAEVALDIEVAASIAPKAKIVVYFAPFSEKGWIDALTAAIHDLVNKPSVLSISWGWPERSLVQDYIWTIQALRAVNGVLKEAAALGVTVCVASGDDGSADELTDGRAHVDFPSSSPYSLGCGGTTFHFLGGLFPAESVWNRGPRRLNGGASGGGISDVFPLPVWQSVAGVPPSVNDGRVRRGVPDVSALADGQTGYTIYVGGRTITNVGGTSAVAPLWAGLVSLINQDLGAHVGWLNPFCYTRLTTAGVFRDVVVGSNDTTGRIGGYAARPGWDASTGWGSPDGTRLLQALGGGTHALRTFFPGAAYGWPCWSPYGWPL
jgi:kumamolisin